jgi:hypothetical protein
LVWNAVPNKGGILGMIYEVIDKVLYPGEIDAVLNTAVKLCPALFRKCKAHTADGMY